MFFSAARCSCFTGGERILVCESESPFTEGVRDAELENESERDALFKICHVMLQWEVMVMVMFTFMFTFTSNLVLANILVKQHQGLIAATIVALLMLMFMCHSCIALYSANLTLHSKRIRATSVRRSLALGVVVIVTR